MTDEPCSGGMSRQIRCLIGMGNGCMKNCNARACPAFEGQKRLALTGAARAVGGVSVSGNDETATKGSCGGCGTVKELSSENKFI